GDGSSTNPATFDVSIQGNGRHYLNEGFALDAGLTGGLFARMPVYFPTKNDDKGEIVVEVTDLNDILNPATTHFSVPSFADLFTGVDLSSTLDVMSDGWGAFFGLVDAALDNQVFVAKIP